MVDISIIVPVYNVEKYLRTCLDSLVNQSYQNIEIIIVNDASPDNSSKIMLEYAQKYKNIKNIFLEENLCLGGARNQGVLYATGDYLMFIDSDDYIDSEYCEMLMQSAKENDSDIVFASYRIIDENSTVKSERYMYPIEFTGTITDEIRRGVINKGAYAWGKLFKRKTWIKNKIFFPEHLKYEDAPTIPLFFMYAKKASYADNVYYYYLKRNNSITQQRNVSYPEDAQKTALLFVERMKERQLYDKYYDEIEHFITERYYSIFIKRCINMYDDIPYEKIEEAKINLKKMYSEYLNNKYIGTFVAEDIIRMKMCEISLRATVSWEKKYLKAMMNDLQFVSAIYYDFYKKKMEYIDEIMSGLNRINLYGQDSKKEAFRQIAHERYPQVTINEDIEKVEQGETIIVVNPGSCIGLKQYNKINRIINFEDFINGYFR